MAFGSEVIDGKMRRFGFSSVKDWFESVIISFPAPWTIGPRDRKYYGTEIFDARGTNILNIWVMAGGPSEREKARFGNWTEERWAEYCCDSHWESEGGLAIAEAIVAMRNSAEHDYEFPNGLAILVMEHGDWDEQCWPEISCGGPDRRALESLRLPTR